ncbi:hypothetical protein [Mesorhizobium sp. WSM3859]|uniref:hypothetical protein n=1 Tax=Mesorhizobium sp. WSM3859 TaxID=2029402 RepID=UPI000BAF40AE|nr:hypothetical protein [Mesorhizobium sp. WSM3859]PBC09108.1 hypothetical protein CK230_16590 [Mesorhizobium sp. WSM3859]
MAKDFDPDYCESKEAIPLVHALGLISIDWNMTEQFMTALIWNYVGGHEIGMSVTNNIGNRSKADMLLDLAKKFEKDKKILLNIEQTVKAFNILRDNRNMLMHSHTVDKNKNGHCEWRRQNPKAPLGSVGMIADLEDLYEVRD